MDSSTIRIDALKQSDFGTRVRTLTIRHFEVHSRLASGESSSSMSPEESLLRHMEVAGLRLHFEVLAAIECGTAYPRDLESFLDALGICCTMTVLGQQLLVAQLAYDILRARFGETLAESIWR